MTDHKLAFAGTTIRREETRSPGNYDSQFCYASYLSSGPTPRHQHGLPAAVEQPAK